MIETDTSSLKSRFHALSPLHKVIALGIIVIVIIFLIICVDVYFQQSRLNKTQNIEARLKKNIDTLYKINSQLKNAVIQHKLLRSEFHSMLDRFSPKSKVDQLLKSITKLGTSEGLTFVFFKPKNELNKGFYAQLPIQMAVLGNFHQLAQFISGLAHLDKLVTMTQFIIRSNSNSSKLTMHLTVSIYRPLDTSIKLGKKARKK